MGALPAACKDDEPSSSRIVRLGLPPRNEGVATELAAVPELPRSIAWLLGLVHAKPELLLMRDPNPNRAMELLTSTLWFSMPIMLAAFGPLANHGWRWKYLGATGAATLVLPIAVLWSLRLHPTQVIRDRV